MKRKRKSCRSHGEKDITQFLKLYKINFEAEKTFNDCRNPYTNRMLRFDFYLPDYNLLIEYQGMHHYQPINKYYRAKKVHETTIAHDLIKSNFCIINNYHLLTIPYWDYKRITDIILQKMSELMIHNIIQDTPKIGVENE